MLVCFLLYLKAKGLLLLEVVLLNNEEMVLEIKQMCYNKKKTKRGETMTKETFFEEYAEDCCESVEDNMEEIFEGIRKGYDLSEDEFYDEIADCYSEGRYSIMTLTQLFTDSSVSIYDILDSSCTEKFLETKVIQKLYNEYTENDEDIMELLEEDSDSLGEEITNAVAEIRTASISDKDMEELKEVMIEILEEYSDSVYVTSAQRKNAFGETLYYILVSDSVEFYV